MLKTVGPKGYVMTSGQVVGFGDAEYEVREAPVPEVRQIIAAHHYSGRAVNNGYVHLGVYWRGALVGVQQWGYAMNPASGRNVVAATANRQYLELNRLWLSDSVPRNAESKSIAYALRYIRAAHPDVEWVQTFADERCARWGVIYQACNFLYCGYHLSDFWLLDGEWYHKVLVTSSGQGQRARHIRANLDRATRHRFRQFRYLHFLRPAARRRLLLPVLPYPKPPSQTMSDTP